MSGYLPLNISFPIWGYQHSLGQIRILWFILDTCLFYAIYIKYVTKAYIATQSLPYFGPCELSVNINNLTDF